MVDLVLEHARLQARGLDLDRLALGVAAADPRVQRALDVHRDPRQAEAALLGERRTSSESHSISGLTSAVGSPSGPAWKTSRRRSTPSWVAARPTPMPSRMIAIIRSTSARSSGPKSVDRRGLALQHRVAELDHVGERRFAALQQLGFELALVARLRRRLARRSARSSLIATRVVCARSATCDRGAHCGSTSTPIATSLQRAVGGAALDRVADRGDGPLAVARP